MLSCFYRFISSCRWHFTEKNDIIIIDALNGWISFYINRFQSGDASLDSDCFQLWSVLFNFLAIVIGRWVSVRSGHLSCGYGWVGELQQCKDCCGMIQHQCESHTKCFIALWCDGWSFIVHHHWHYDYDLSCCYVLRLSQTWASVLWLWCYWCIAAV